MYRCPPSGRGSQNICFFKSLGFLHTHKRSIVRFIAQTSRWLAIRSNIEDVRFKDTHFRFFERPFLESDALSMNRTFSIWVACSIHETGRLFTTIRTIVECVWSPSAKPTNSVHFVNWIDWTRNSSKTNKRPVAALVVGKRKLITPRPARGPHSMAASIARYGNPTHWVRSSLGISLRWLAMQYSVITTRKRTRIISKGLFSNSFFELVTCVLWNCSQENGTEPILMRIFNIGSGNGFVPDGTKPLPESMLTRPLSSYGVTRPTMGEWQQQTTNTIRLTAILSLA